jgi:hypothetical protein
VTLVVVAIASLFLAFLTAGHRWRPLALAGAFLLRIGLPSSVGDINVSGFPHVSTVLIMSYVAIWPLVTPRKESNTQDSPPRIPLLCHVVLGVVAVGSIIMSGRSLSAVAFAAGYVLNQIVAPYIFCVFVYNATCQRESVHKAAGRLFASACVVESIVALAVNFRIIPQPYLSADPTVMSLIGLGERQPGTLGHPLTLGLLLAAGIPMAAYFRSRITEYFAVSIIIVGTGLTQSRIALVGALVGLAYLLIIAAKSLRGRITLLVTVAASYTFLNLTGILQGLLDRIQSDEGSSKARSEAFRLFRDSWSNFKVSGVGMQFDKEYFLSHGLRSSGESAAIDYAVGIGIPLTVLYFSLIIWMIVRGIQRAKSLSPASTAAIITLASIQFYSSIATESAAGIILWTTIGLALATPQTVVSPRIHDISSQVPDRGRT